MENELRLATEIFRKKVKYFEEEYKENNTENFEKKKMKDYINRKMKKDIRFLLGVNLFLPAVIISNNPKI